MLLAIDVGNTQVVLGLFEADAGDPVHRWRMATNRHATSDELALILQGFLGFAGHRLSQVQGVCLSSVVPALTFALRRMVAEYLPFEAVVVEPGTRTGMAILIDTPREVGADRVVNAVAAFDRFGGPLVVVDFGTATTYDAVSADGAYLGGAIAPGLEISANALYDHAAGLRRAELVLPRSPIGKGTIEALQSGLLYGYASQVDGMIARFREALGTPAISVATGGLASTIAPHCSSVDHVDDFLTLKGLRLIHARNRAPMEPG